MRWPRFTRSLTRELRSNDFNLPVNRNLTNDEIDKHIQRMDETIKRTMDKTIPKTTVTDHINMYRNTTINALHRKKSRLLSKLKQLHRQFTDRQDQEIISLKSRLKNLQQLLKANYRLATNLYWNNRIRAIKTNNPNMFPQINKIFRRNNQNEIQCLQIPRTDVNKQLLTNIGIDTENAILNSELFVIEDPLEKVNAVGAVFQEMYKVNESIRRNHDLEDRVLLNHLHLRNEISLWQSENPGFTEFSDDNLSIDINANGEANSLLITREGIQSIFDSLRSKKSVGIDGVPNIVLKNLPPMAIDIYTVLFNNALNNAYYPARWKTAIIQPIAKKGKDCTNPMNMRSISLLPSISKAFEKTINKALLKWVDDNSIIPNNQFGFKAGHETTHAAAKLVSDIQWNKCRNQCTGACLIDLEKAFDTVWIEGLYYKLVRHGIHKPLLYVLYDMLKDRRFVVKNGNVTSNKTYNIKNGLQQGAVLSPILFNIYISDLLDALPQAIAYADDLIIYRTAPKVEVINSLIQRDFNNVQRYCDDWKLKINFQKCEAILFRTPLYKATNDTRKNWRKLVIVGPHGDILETKSVVKYLGIWLDQYLYFNRHVEAALVKARKTFAMTRRLFHSSQLDSRVKVICYMTLIRPMLIYGCPVWFNIGPNLMEKIRVFERKCLRSCLRLYRTPESDYKKYYSNETLYNEAYINRVDNFMIKLIRGHIARAISSSNDLIFGAYYPNTLYYESVRRNGFVPPEAFLDLDMKGLIQDRSGIPLIYHVSRSSVDGRLCYDREVTRTEEERLRFSRAISHRDRDDSIGQREQFWWLNGI